MTDEEKREVGRAAQALLEAAAEQRGVQRVLDAAYELLELPILLNDLVFHPIAWIGPERFGPEKMRRKDGDDSVKMRQWMRKVKASHGEPIIDEEGNPYRVMCCDVHVRGIEVAKLSMYELRPFHPTDPAVLKLLSGAVACVLGEDEGRLPEQRMGNLVRNLILGEMEPAEVERALSLFQIPREKSRRVLVLRDLQGDGIDYPGIETRCFYQLGGTAITLGDRVVCLLEEEIDRETISRFAEKNRLRGGLSNFFSSIVSLRDYYAQGQFALGRAEREEKALVEYRDCLVQDAAEHCLRDRTAASFCRPEVLRLWEYDRLHGTDYMETLQCYCQNLCSVTETARAGFLHYNTVKYRLKAIRDLTGMGELRGRDIFEFWLSFRLLGLKEPDAGTLPLDIPGEE